MAALAFLGAASRASAQGRITIAVGDGTPLRIQQGTSIAVPFTVDMSAAAGANLAALTATLQWGSGQLLLDSVKAGAFGTLSSNTAAAEGGVAVVSAFSAVGATSSTTLGTLYFRTFETAGGTRVTLTPFVAGDELGASVLGLIRTRGLDVCVALPGRWGDANGDNGVDILDAQQVARFSIGLSVLNPSAVRGEGDVNADGNVDIVDAQQIARYSVDDPAVPRVNAPTLVVPEASAITTPATMASVQVAGRVQVTASAVDTSGVPLGGCAPITWTSSDTTKATVDQEGVVTGIAVGIPTITATSGGVFARIAMNVGVGAVPASMTIVQGDGQYSIDANYGVKAQVRVVDALNQAVPGVSVLFTANPGGVVTLKSGAQKPSATVVTDSSGVAEIAGWSGGGTPVPGQTTFDGTELQSAERVIATVPGLPPVTITGIALYPGVSPSICLLTIAGAAYCHGEYVSDALESADSTLGSVPVLVSDGVPMATLSPAFDGSFSCGVARTGDGYCWGWNPAGQLGDGTENRSKGMRRVAGGLSFIKISSAFAHACGITTSGRPYCWGLNEHGQLGTGPMGGISNIPVAVRGTDQMLDIATGWSATCGVTTGGDTWCWGSAPFIDSAGTRVPVPRRIPGVPAFTKISLGLTVACGMTSAGQVNCWGTGGPALGDGSTANRYGSFSTVALPAPARELWGILDNFCASTTAGGLYCWGINNATTLAGVGDPLPHSTPVLVGFVNALRGQMQPFGFCYQDPSNQPFCFGSYAIGDGLPTFSSANPTRFSPVPVKWVEGLPNAAASITVVAGARQSAASGASVLAAPSVLVRDYTGNPVAGDTVTFRVASGGGSVTGSVAVADASGIATVGSWTLGSAPGLNLLIATAATVSTSISAQATLVPALFNIGSGNNQIQVGTPKGSNSITSNYPGSLAVRVLDAQERPVVGAAVTFAMTAGPNDFSGLTSIIAQTDGAGIASVIWSARTVGSSTATASVAGLAPLTFTGTSVTGILGLARCELNSGGQALCWGDNRRGQVGDGTTTNRTQPTAVSGGANFTSIAKGAADHACGLIAGEQAICWGANSFGQLGDGSTTDRTTPVVAANGFTFTKLAVGPYTTCGLTPVGSIVCWGWSSFGLFGDDDRGTIRPPTFVAPGEFIYSDIALGGFHACALESGGAAQCWGNGIGGELGDGTLAIRSTPARVTGGRTFTSIATGNFYTCALTPTGDAYCWGVSGNGNFSTPTQVGAGLNFTSISPANSSYTCGRTADGVVYCWGFGTNGQLGNGNTSTQFTPAPVLSGVSFASVSTRGSSACALTSNGQPYCWGVNAQGQLGDGTTTLRNLPVAAKWPEGVTGVPVSLTINAGNNQTATASTAVAVSPSVVVKDYAGTPLIGTPVTFTVTSGGGTVTTATVTTNAFGIATVGSWILGPTPGTNTLTVTAPGLPTVVFTATGQ